MRKEAYDGDYSGDGAADSSVQLAVADVPLSPHSL